MFIFILKFVLTLIYISTTHTHKCIYLSYVYIYHVYISIIEGSIEVKLPTIWTDGKAEVGRVREEKKRSEKIREEKGSEERRGRCTKKVGKCHSLCFSNDLWLQRVESRLAKAAGVEPSGQMRDEKLHAVRSQAHFEVKMHKTHQLRSTLRSCEVEILHAVVARSTFPSQNVQSTPFSDHFWKFRCRKRARRCGEKHVSKSKA